MMMKRFRVECVETSVYGNHCTCVCVCNCVSLSIPLQPWEKVRKFVQALSPFTLQFNKKKYAWVQLAGHQGMVKS